MPGIRRHEHAAGAFNLIGLSVAVGRFVEALFWAIMRVAGWVSVAAIAAIVALVLVAVVMRKLWARRR